MSTQIEALLRKSGAALNWLILASSFAMGKFSNDRRMR